MIDLSAAGLKPTEAKVYQALLSKKEWKPADLAKSVGETRTNIYKVLDKLVELELANRYDKDSKLHYKAKSPTQLIELARKKRKQIAEAELNLESNVNNLLETFSNTNLQPSVRYFHGKEELELLYIDQANSNQPISFIYSSSGVDLFGFEKLHSLRMLSVSKKIPRKALTQDIKTAPIDYRRKDPLVNLERTWLEDGLYTSPVEFGVYGDKTYFASFENEQIGIIIESKQIAESIRQILEIIHKKQVLDPRYKLLPQNARGFGKTK